MSTESIAGTTVGAATAANQVIEAASLSSIDSKLTPPVKVSLEDVIGALRVLLQAISRPVWHQPVTNDIRVAVQSGSLTGVTTVTTVATVTNVAQLGGTDPRPTFLYDLTRSCWAVTVRNRIA